MHLSLDPQEKSMCWAKELEAFNILIFKQFILHTAECLLSKPQSHECWSSKCTISDDFFIKKIEHLKFWYTFKSTDINLKKMYFKQFDNY